MENYKEISIDIVENGVIVKCSDGKDYVFTNTNKLRKWLKDNLAPTGEVERFSNALDDEEKPYYSSLVDNFNHL